MENKLLKNPQHVARLGYNPFAMHQIVDRTDTVGQITPCYYDFLQPGDKISASVKLQTRTQPLLAPAYCNVRECVDWFFVPTTQILQQFGNWYDNVRDEKSDFYANLTASNSPRNLPTFKLTDYLGYIFGAMQTDVVSGVGYLTLPQYYFDTLRLMDTLHIPVATYMSEWNLTEGDNLSSFNQTARQGVLFAAAYQKIYYDYFRLSDREANDVQAYNFDSLMASTGTPDAANNVSNTRLDKVFKLHYVPFKKDFFTNLQVSPIQGQSDLSSYGVNLGEVSQWLSGLTSVRTGVPITSSLFPDGGSLNVSGSLPSDVRLNSTTSTSFNINAPISMISPSNLETLYAVRKMLEISRRSGKHFDAQTLAHYGINVPTGISGECLHLGHHEQNLVIGDVISTSNTYDLTGNTEGSPLGELAGKGYSSGRQNIEVKFTAPYSGILMAVYYAVPDVVYSQHGLDRVQTYSTIADFPRPELTNLGMQPLFGYQSTVSSSMTPDAVLGWQYQFTELKMKPNVAYGGVHQDGDLKYWALTGHELPSNALGAFLVPPTYLNRIMYYDFKYDTAGGVKTAITGQSGTYYLKLQYGRAYDSDPLIHHFEFKVMKVSKMSTYGLMNF